MRVGHVHHLVQLQRDEQHRRARVPLGDELPVDVLNRAHVQSARRLHGHQHARAHVQLARDDRLLLVAAGHGARNRVCAARRADIKLRNQSFRLLIHARVPQKAVPLDGRLVVIFERQVFGQVIIKHQPVPVPVLGNVRKSAIVARADGSVRHIATGDGYRARGDGHKPGDRARQFALAIAIHARDAHDLTAAHGKTHIVHRVFAVRPLHAQPAHFQRYFARMRGRFFHDKVHFVPHHHFGKGFLAGGLYVHGADAAALAQNRAAIGDLLDFVELVGDEDQALALGGEALHDFHQFADFLRREHSGGFIEDEDFIVAVEHFQNFHALLHAHRNVLDARVRIDHQAVLPGKRQHLFARLVHFKHAAPGILHTQDHVFQHGKIVHELEMLVHHADSQSVRVVGIVDLHDLPIFADHAAIRRIQAEEHAHQRGFPRTVLAKQRVDFSLFQLKGNMVVCADADEFLHDILHFNDIRQGHPSRIFFRQNASHFAGRAHGFLPATEA